MRRGFRLAAAVIVIGAVNAVSAQPKGHQMPAPAAQAPATPIAAASGCVQGAQKALTIVARANAGGRTAATRAELRRSIEQMTVAARSAQAELAGCAAVPAVAVPVQSGVQQAAAPAMDHSKMKTSGRGAAPPPAAAPMDHSKMKMAGRGGAPPPGAAGTPAKPAPVDHSKMNMGPQSNGPAGTEKNDPRLPVMPAERVMDPACPTADIATAPKAAFARKVYYFCSDREREEFRKDPAAYLKKRPRG